ncbi:Uncharacterised protein [uncultured archaeon]|nr:Uncharacterised protein [uncultured archaeon]
MLTLKFTVYWWIRADGRQKQGHDIVDSNDADFDTYDAETMIESDLDDLREDPSIDIESKKLPKFCESHIQLSFAAKHSEISNWGVRKVAPVKP